MCLLRFPRSKANFLKLRAQHGTLCGRLTFTHWRFNFPYFKSGHTGSKTVNSPVFSSGEKSAELSNNLLHLHILLQMGMIFMTNLHEAIRSHQWNAFVLSEAVDQPDLRGKFCRLLYHPLNEMLTAWTLSNTITGKQIEWETMSHQCWGAHFSFWMCWIFCLSSDPFLSHQLTACPLSLTLYSSSGSAACFMTIYKHFWHFILLHHWKKKKTTNKKGINTKNKEENLWSV